MQVWERQKQQNMMNSKLISTSYAKSAFSRKLTMFEQKSPLYDASLHKTRGKLFTLTRDKDGSGMIDTDDIEFSGYLDGDGDSRSDEVCRLRDEADIIVTNPPFSGITSKNKKQGFLEWLIESGKQFIILGNMNAITYKEMFPYLRDNVMWLGYKSLNQDMYFNVTDDYKQWLLENKKEGSAYKIIDGVVMGRLASACWFTNIDHGKRHEVLQLDTMAHNLKYNKKLKKKLAHGYGIDEYPHFDNYDALEVPFSECIPIDYDGVMGVPITFLDKYNPEQFEIIGITLGNTIDFPMTRQYKNAIQHNKDGSTQGGSKVNTRAAVRISKEPKDTVYYTADNSNGYLLSIYPRILIRPKEGDIN